MLNKDVESSEANELTADEIDNFFKKIHEKGVFCPIMDLREPISKYSVEKRSETNISIIQLFLASRFNDAYQNLSIEDLREIANDINFFFFFNFKFFYFFTKS